MANEYLKPQIPLKDLNSENYFYPLTTLDLIIIGNSRLSAYLLENNGKLIFNNIDEDSVGGSINLDGITTNRTLFVENDSLLSSENIFINNDSLAINKISITEGYNFEVNGNSNLNGRIALIHGIYTATENSRYTHSALEIRENDLVGTALTDIGYAPTIGFHWSGRVGSTLSLGSDGIFYFRKQNGLERSTINAFLPNTSHGDNTADTTSYSWHKVASVTIKAAYHDRWIKLSITNGYSYPHEMGILLARVRVTGELTLQNADLVWLVAGSSIRLDSFKLVYYNETNLVRAELWYLVLSLYLGVHFTIIDLGAREFILGEGESDWQLTERVWGHGLASCPTGSGSVNSGTTFLLNTVNQARYLENRGGSTVTINDTVWNHGLTGAAGSTNRATVWHLRWLLSGLTYTPSGGSATTLTDCGDMVIWLSSSPTANTLQTNIAIDGLMFALDGFKTNQWYRSIGNVGWYSLSYGGGWYMTDTTWIRSYGSKAVYTGSGIIRSDGAVWGNKVVINGDWLGFYNGPQGATRYGYIQANANRMYFRKENGALNNVAFDFGSTMYCSGEVMAPTHMRVGATILRDDGSNFYFLIGTRNAPGNNWNSLRPFYFNLSNGYSYHTRAYQAVWNDYAEFRQGDTIEPGRVVIEQKNGIMTMALERLAPGAKIISDTYGLAMGETKKAKTPIAVSGRVLVYPFKDRKEYELGAAVCAAPGGTVDIMTREEIREYPERIIGTVSEIPDYDIWHAGGSVELGPAEEIKVNGRIWVYVR